MDLDSLDQVKLKNSGISFGAFRLEQDGTLLRGRDRIHLTPKELAALRFLLEHAGQVVTPAQLQQALWGNIHVTADSVPRCVSSLRARLEPEKWIETVYKRGYRMRSIGEPAVSVPGIPRLAIVPFSCAFHVEEHLGRTISEESAARLTKMDPPVANVVARDSVFALSDKGLPALQIGEALGADLVLTGTLKGWLTHLTLRAEMIRVRDGTQIWTEEFLVGSDRRDSMNQSLVERIVFRLGNTATHEEPTQPANGDPRSYQAYELYLCGRSALLSMDRDRMQGGLDLLLQSLELHPALMSARADLLQASITQCIYGFTPSSRTAEFVQRAADGLKDPERNVPNLLPSLGWAAYHLHHDAASATRLFSACAYLPHDAWTTRMRVMYSLSRHQWEQALDTLHSALRDDPFSPWLHAVLGWTLHLADRAAESVEQIEYCLAAYPRDYSAAFYGSMILAFHDQPARAIELAGDLVQRSPYFDMAAAILAYVHARRGDCSKAQRIVDKLRSVARERFVSSTFLAPALAALGDTDGAIQELKAGFARRCPWYFQVLADPRNSALHDHPEYHALIAGARHICSEAVSERLTNPAGLAQPRSV